MLSSGEKTLQMRLRLMHGTEKEGRADWHLALRKRVANNRTHAPSLLQNTRLSSNEANPLSRSRN